MCICIYMYISMYTSIYIYAYIRICIGIHVCLCVCVNLWRERQVVRAERDRLKGELERLDPVHPPLA